MANSDAVPPGGHRVDYPVWQPFVVLREIADGIWRFVGEADRRPGLRAEAARAQAVQDVTDGTAGAGEVYAVVLRSEWRTALRR